MTTTAVDTRQPVARPLDDGWDDARYRPQFPTPELLGAAAAMFPPRPYWIGNEGPIPRIEIAPGVVAISRRDYARANRTAERAVATRRTIADQLAVWLRTEGRFPHDPIPTRQITAWSQKSRVRMRKTIGQIDWSEELSPERAPAMVTLTYPGDWLAVAPDGKTSKRHVKQFKKAYARAWKFNIAGFWKLEFQRRGAPHYHIFTVTPRGTSKRAAVVNGHTIDKGLPFKIWLSLTWAACVDPRDPQEMKNHIKAGTGVDYEKGLRGRDPQRIAEYFTKDAQRSAKEYQNIVPRAWRAVELAEGVEGPAERTDKGPGRFWGYWGIWRRVHGVELSHADAVAASRVMRRWFAAKAGHHWQPKTKTWQPPATTPRVSWRRRGGSIDTTRCPNGRYEVIGLAGAQLVAGVAPARPRFVRRRIRRMHYAGGAGWISVNDGAAYATQLSRHLDQAREYRRYSHSDKGVTREPEQRAGPPPPGLCRSCGESRRSHRCPAYLASRADRAAKRRQPS